MKNKIYKTASILCLLLISKEAFSREEVIVLWDGAYERATVQNCILTTTKKKIAITHDDDPSQLSSPLGEAQCTSYKSILDGGYSIECLYSGETVLVTSKNGNRWGIKNHDFGSHANDSDLKKTQADSILKRLNKLNSDCKSSNVKYDEKWQRINEKSRAEKDQQTCSSLYVGKAVKIRLCNAVFGCTNFDAEITGVGNDKATAKITTSGDLYGERRELPCDQF